VCRVAWWGPLATLEVDAVVVGAGVVGLACAERLARNRRSVIVIDAHAGFGRETSSRNSEVVHAGIYYPTGSLKARLCIEGAEALYAWCGRHGVDCLPVGKYIVATSKDEEPALGRILEQAHANGAREVRQESARALARAEPNVRATAALWSPRTGILDSHAFMTSLHAEASRQGCIFAWRHRLVAASPSPTGFELDVATPDGDRETVVAPIVVNAAGLHADDVAALPGLDVDDAGYRQVYVKGNYFRLQRRGLVHHLVYPVPPPALTGLGLHVTVNVGGELRIGPDVEPLDGRTLDYDVDETRRDSFFRAASRYLVGLHPDDLHADQAGIRPKLIPCSASPGLPRDFVIADESSRGLPGWVNLIGIESPGLTASLAIARLVATKTGCEP
jgi:L-2-hydroxyglutarate oxidase LhgO